LEYEVLKQNYSYTKISNTVNLTCRLWSFDTWISKSMT